MTIFIGNFSWNTEKEDLIDLFKAYGEVTNCTIPLERDSGRKRGFGFVEMANKSSEKKAIDDLQDVEWMGREIRVNKAEPKQSSRMNKRRYGIKHNSWAISILKYFYWKINF